MVGGEDGDGEGCNHLEGMNESGEEKYCSCRCRT